MTIVMMSDVMFGMITMMETYLVPTEWYQQ